MYGAELVLAESHGILLAGRKGFDGLGNSRNYRERKKRHRAVAAAGMGEPPYLDV